MKLRHGAPRPCPKTRFYITATDVTARILSRRLPAAVELLRMVESTTATRHETSSGRSQSLAR